MRYALRTLAREKLFTAFAVLTLALGIGGVTAIFSIVDAVLLCPLPFKDPGRLYAAAEAPRALLQRNETIPVNASHFRSWQDQCRSCESGALLNPATFNLTGGGEPERIDGVTCTWPLFQVLGIEAQLGRTFLEGDDQPGVNKFVVVSDTLWRRRLGADAAAIGRPIWIDGEPHIVVGVLRPDFHLPSGNQLGPLNRFAAHADIFKPMGFDWAKLWRLGQFNFACLIRLRPGANPVRAEGEMTAAIADAARDMKTELKVRLVQLHEQVTGGSRTALMFILSAVMVVLLIVCLNLGSLMLVRASKRSPDAAIRRALGAAAGDLLRAVIAENMLIALCGGTLGVLLAHASVRVLVNTAPIDIPRLNEVHLSWTTLVLALGISLVSGILSGIWPAIRSMYGNATYVMRTIEEPSTMANALRSAMHELDAQLPLANVLTMQEVMSESVHSRRFQTMLAELFAGVALLLACLGIYGVISYGVAQRTNEIGLRIALGAQPSQVSMLVLRQGIRPVMGGLLAGVAALMVAGQWIGGILFGTRAGNPAALAAVVALMLLVAAAACWAPAWRASRIDPMAALQNE